MSPDGLSRIRPKRRSFLSISDDEITEQHSRVEDRRISIMPAYFDTDEQSTSSLESGRLVTCVERAFGVNGIKESTKFCKRTLTSNILAENDPSRVSHLRNFNHIDYRNCQCNGIIDCLFWKIYQHLESTGHSERFVRFMADYCAGLIQTGQSSQVMKLLTVAYEKNKASSVDIRFIGRKAEEKRINQGALLALMGDASTNLGDYVEARRYYTEAVRICVNSSWSIEKICVSYSIFDQTCKQKLHQRYPDYFVNRITGYDVATKLSASAYLARLSTILLRIGQNSSSKLAALESFNNGFACSGSFAEKCDIYLRIVRIFRDLEDLPFARSFEKQMMHTIRSKHWWSVAEDVKAVAIVLKSMFEIRLLRGEYEDALIMATKVIKISAALKMSRTKLKILPELIQLAIRMKRIHETVDLMRELYHSAPEDIDESGITWYYALSLDLALDAGMILESFENCIRHAKTIIGSKFRACVSRDPDSLRRLLTCLWLWQLRMSNPPTFAQSLEFYTSDIRADNFSQVLTISKALECFLLTLTRCINMKRADQLMPLLDDIECIVGILVKISKNVLFIKPRLFMLKAYMEIVRGRRCTSQRYLKKASKLAMDQGNPMMLAWIRQNERFKYVSNYDVETAWTIYELSCRDYYFLILLDIIHAKLELTWEIKQYNNMSHYWVEHVGFNGGSDWQNIHCFNIKTWSSTLFPIPIPDTFL